MIKNLYYYIGFVVIVAVILGFGNFQPEQITPQFVAPAFLANTLTGATATLDIKAGTSATYSLGTNLRTIYDATKFTLTAQQYNPTFRRWVNTDTRTGITVPAEVDFTLVNGRFTQFRQVTDIDALLQGGGITYDLSCGFNNILAAGPSGGTTTTLKCLCIATATSDVLCELANGTVVNAQGCSKREDLRIQFATSGDLCGKDMVAQRQAKCLEACKANEAVKSLLTGVTADAKDCQDDKENEYKANTKCRIVYRSDETSEIGIGTV